MYALRTCRSLGACSLQRHSRGVRTCWYQTREFALFCTTGMPGSVTSGMTGVNQQASTNAALRHGAD